MLNISNSIQFNTNYITKLSYNRRINFLRVLVLFNVFFYAHMLLIYDIHCRSEDWGQ